LAQTFSVRTMPCERSMMLRMAPGTASCEKLGQPQPASNLVADSKSLAPQQTQW